MNTNVLTDSEIKKLRLEHFGREQERLERERKARVIIDEKVCNENIKLFNTLIIEKDYPSLIIKEPGVIACVTSTLDKSGYKYHSKKVVFTECVDYHGVEEFVETKAHKYTFYKPNGPAVWIYSKFENLMATEASGL
jgi:hypothetical protein